MTQVGIKDYLSTAPVSLSIFLASIQGSVAARLMRSSCLQATQQTAIAQSAYNATDITMPDYTDLCNAYKQALMTQISVCGDSNGTLQALVDGLGTCVP